MAQVTRVQKKVDGRAEPGTSPGTRLPWGTGFPLCGSPRSALGLLIMGFCAPGASARGITLAFQFNKARVGCVASDMTGTLGSGNSTKLPQRPNEMLILNLKVKDANPTPRLLYSISRGFLDGAFTAPKRGPGNGSSVLRGSFSLSFSPVPSPHLSPPPSPSPSVSPFLSFSSTPSSFSRSVSLSLSSNNYFSCLYVQ